MNEIHHDMEWGKFELTGVIVSYEDDLDGCARPGQACRILGPSKAL